MRARTGSVGAMRRVPLRVRLVLGFSAAMLVVLIAAGAFVFWRVQYALDARLRDDLGATSADAARVAASAPDPAAAVEALGGEGRDVQLLGPDGRVLAAGSDLRGRPPLPTRQQSLTATRRPVAFEQGNLFSGRDRHVRVRALPVPGSGPVVVAVTAVRMDQRDEALRELLGQLALANLGALAVASLVGYRLARAALAPVERYRARAEEIAAGASGVRLEVPAGADDEISRLGATLNHMLVAQEHAAEQQRRFIDDASHELRTPVTVLAAEIDLALRRPRSREEYEKTIRELQVDAERLVALADDLLTLGAQGIRTPSATVLPADRILEPAADRARRLLEGQGRAVDVHLAPGLELYGDPSLLSRAMGNLVDNAVRYGEGVVLVGSEPIGSGGCRLFVSDEGEGMAPDFLPQATERFRQAQESRTTGGSGLGLALVEAIVGAHGGQFRLCSRGVHHRSPTADPGLDAIPCRHRTAGTTASMLLHERPDI